MIWQYLKNIDRPVVLYGMGNGADKIIAAMIKYDTEPSGVVASDEFVRGQKFHGFDVRKISDIDMTFGRDCVILVCFGTSRPNVLNKIYSLQEKYEIYAPDVPVYGNVPEDLFDDEFYEKNIANIKFARELFADEYSKKVYDNLIEYKLNGEIGLLKNFLTFREDDMNLLQLYNNNYECFLDLGAYKGDTIEEFIKIKNKKFCKIIAVEPDPKNFKFLINFLRENFNNLDIKAINAAVQDKEGFIDFNISGGRHSFQSLYPSQNLFLKKNISVKSLSIDGLCKSENFIPTLIKFDIEGCEKKAVIGGENIIKNCKPKMIVSAYHRSEDLFSLPILINKLNSKYKIFLRRQECVPAWEVNLYCV